MDLESQIQWRSLTSRTQPPRSLLQTNKSKIPEKKINLNIQQEVLAQKDLANKASLGDYESANHLRDVILLSVSIAECAYSIEIQ